MSWMVTRALLASQAVNPSSINLSPAQYYLQINYNEVKKKFDKNKQPLAYTRCCLCYLGKREKALPAAAPIPYLSQYFFLSVRPGNANLQYLMLPDVSMFSFILAGITIALLFTALLLYCNTCMQTMSK